MYKYYSPRVMTALAALLIVLSAATVWVVIESGIQSVAVWCFSSTLYVLAIATTRVWSRIWAGSEKGAAVHPRVERLGMGLHIAWTLNVFMLVVTFYSGI